MNLLLISPEELSEDGMVTLTDRRFRQVVGVHGSSVGDSVRVGMINGQMGDAEVVSLSEHQVVLKPQLTLASPEPLPLALVLALPRPKMLKRCLRMVAELGVKQIYLINSYRVEKSFWSSPLLEPESIQENLLLGLEQAKDTRLPEVQIRKRFKPFVEDELPELAKGVEGYVAHPVSGGVELGDVKTPIRTPALVAIGPEGGWIPYEVDKLQEAGLKSLTFGERILRVETALPFLLGRLFF